jgi:hypothetical protein
MTTRQEISRNERIALWPFWVGIGFPLSLILIEATPGFWLFWLYLAMIGTFSGLGLHVVLLPWACAGAWAAIRSVQCLGRRAWRQATVYTVLPLVVLGAGLHLQPFIYFCNDAGDIVFFRAVRPLYLRTIRATSNKEPRLLVFDRGGMLWSSRGFVYDESDEVLRRPSLQSAAWKVRVGGTELSCDGYYARPFPGHFEFTRHWYLASFPC